MAKKDKPQNPGGEDTKPRKPSSEDLDKTTIDIDIRQLEGTFDETVIVRVPPKEDSDLHDTAYFDEERTGDHVLEDHPGQAKEQSLLHQPTEDLPKKRREEPKAKPKTKVAVTPPKESRPKPAPQEEISLLREAEPEPAMIRESEAPSGKPKRSALYMGLTFLFFLLLAEGTVEVLRQGAALRWPAILCTGFSVLLLGGALLKRWSGKTAFLGTAFAWFGLVTYSGLRFYTSDPEALHFFKLPLEFWVGPCLLVAGAIIAMALSGIKGLSSLPKLLGWIACLILIVAVGLAFAGGQNLEDGLWGPAALAKVPLFLRPGTLALGLAFPLATLAVLLAFVMGVSGKRSFLKSGAWALLGLGVLGSLLGVKLLSRQGIEVPLLSRFVRQSFFGVTVLDPFTSPIRLQVGSEKPGFGQSDWMHLSVAASNSRAQGKERQSWLMMKNQEGRDFVTGNLNYLRLSRGDKSLRGVKAEVDASRLGKRRQIALLVNLAALVETQTKSATVSAIYQLASALRNADRLHLVGPGGAETLDPGEPDTWHKKIDKVLSAAASSGDLAAEAFKRISGSGGLKQFILLTDAAKLPAADQRAAMSAEAKKNQAAFSVLVLGTVENPDPEIYLAPTASDLGFGLLDSAAETLGDVSLQFPQLAPLPRVKWSKDVSGKAIVQAEKVDFEILAEDPAAVQSLQLKVDDDKPVDLDKAQLKQSLDLGTLKIKPGSHRLVLLLTSQEGDVVSDVLEMQYNARRSLRFIKPLDKDTIAGNFNIMFSVGKAQGLETQSLDLNVDGTKTGQTTSQPFMIPLNSTTLSEGIHTLQAVQTYTDGSTETAQVQVNVNQQVPQVQILRPSIGEYLPNLAEIEAQVGGGLFEQVQKVEFLVDGEWIGESLQAPFRLLWSNNAFPAGNYFVQARAYLSSQATSTDAVQIQLGQGELVVQADSAVSPTGMLFPDNVEVLIDASSVMQESVGHSLKIDLAKMAMLDLLQTVPQNVRLSARVVGAGSLASQKNCEDIKLLKNPAGDLESLQAQGVFPLARGLESLEKDMKKTEGSRVGLVIADDWDACNGDPIAVATRLAKEGDRLRLHIIYFSDVDPTTESLLKRLAEVTGGRTYKVSRQEDLQQAIRDAVQVNFSLYDYKNSPVAVMPLSQNPLTVRAGEYRLEIDTAPPVVRGNVVISAGARKTFTVVNQEGKYEVKGE